jgi:hypothetical protein
MSYKTRSFLKETDMQKLVYFLVPLMAVLILSADVNNRDKPKKGEWNFSLEEVWKIEKAGEDVFGRPFSLSVSNEGYIYIYDAANSVNYIFNGDGQFVKAFAPAGQGPGEILGQGPSFVIGDSLIIDGIGDIHYFTEKGDYVKSVKKDALRYDPHFFLSGSECITAPLTVIHMSDGKGEIVRSDLQSGEERIISSFSIFEGSVASNGDQVIDVIVPGLTPMMTMGVAGDRLYWGMNDSYVINVTGLEGKKLGAFKIKRKNRKISDSFKKQYFKKDDIPPDMLKQLVDNLPNEISCFHRIDVQNGLVYVYVPELELGQKWPKIKQIDIFSPDGEYLYKARLEFGEDLKPLFSPLHNLAIQGENLIIVLTDKQDNVVVSKYKIKLPVYSGD